MILIDSLYINNSGGLRILEYLVAELQKRNVDFYLLADARCYGHFDSCKHVSYMNASLWGRKNFYRTKINQFSAVLCFGNIPVPIKHSVPVYTYFHNINLLTLSEALNFREKITMWLKREVFRFYKKNTDLWLVQTTNTAAELCRYLSEKPNRVMMIPFYELPDGLQKLKNDNHGDDYAYVSYYTGAKGHEELLNAWILLYRQGMKRNLHLTVPFECKDFCDKIKQAQEEGVMVVNHGSIPFDKVMELYLHSKVIIYPSHNESLGLSIIEAITAGCDVIGADLPYLHSVCKPSQIFNPYSPESIKNAVLRYEEGSSSKSELLIHNKLGELIDLLQYN